MSTRANAIIKKLEVGLTPLGVFRSRPMFGGHGLYLDDVFFGLIAYDTLYLKTDEDSRPDFEKAKLEPFTFESRKGVMITSYWKCPPAALKDAAKLRQWVSKGHEAARRVKAAKPKRKARRKAISAH